MSLNTNADHVTSSPDRNGLLTPRPAHLNLPNIGGHSSSQDGEILDGIFNLTPEPKSRTPLPGSSSTSKLDVTIPSFNIKNFHEVCDITINDGDKDITNEGEPDSHDILIENNSVEFSREFTINKSVDSQGFEKLDFLSDDPGLEENIFEKTYVHTHFFYFLAD